MATYDPEQWHDFFMTVGAGAAAMTGLVVVAISMHLRIIAKDLVLRHRARTILLGLGGVFVRCSLALMGGQGGRAVAIELFVVCCCVTIFGLLSYAPISRIPAPHRASFMRTLGTAACYGTEMYGAALLFFGATWGLTLAAVAMVANFIFMISGCWLLMIGIRHDEMAA